MKKELLAILSVGLLAGPTAVSATVISYFDRSAWGAVVGPTVTEDFNGITEDVSFISPASATVGSMTFSGGEGYNGALTQMIDAPEFEFLLSPYTPNGTTFVLADLTPTNSLRIDFSSGVAAWGGDFTGLANGTRTTQIDVFDSDDSLLGSVFVDSSSDVHDQRFVGFLLSNSNPAHHIVFNVRFANPYGINDVWGLDDVAYLTVPEPGTLALLGLGLAGLGFARRRNLN